MAATFWTGAGISDVFDTNAGMPGAAPLGTGAMQGNPNSAQVVVPAVNVEPPIPQNTAAQLLASQVSQGNIPLNLQPTNTKQETGPQTGREANAGGDSLLAMQARGQLLRGDSTYGQSGYIPANGSGFVPSASVAVTQPTGAASGVTYANNGNYSGM